VFPSNRPSIKPYLIPYCEQIAVELGTTDLSEVVATIILDHKRDKCACSHSSNSMAQPRNAVSDNLMDELSGLLDP
jgi:hypothetical protein